MGEDQKVVDLARQKGLLKDPRVEASDDLTLLVQKGILNEDTIIALRGEVEERMDAPTQVGEKTDTGIEACVDAKSAEPTHGESWGPFEHLEFLGQGGMARVFRAYDPNLQRHIAVKVIRTDDPELATRLLMEAKTQARIEHPNVCKVYDAGQIYGKPYIEMQYIHGRSLKEVRPMLSMEQRIRIMIEVCEAVHAAHRAGLIHRDLKPANIMVEQKEDGEWVPYVMDFGLAREAGSTGLTETGRVIGTLWYMSPEQARGNVRSLDRRSDVYSLGITLYELVADRSPYEVGSDVDFLMNLVDQSTSMIRELDPKVPDELSTIIMKCVEKEPHRRYDSARDLAADLERYLDGEPITARRANIAYTLWKKARKHKITVAIGAVALVATLTFLGMWLQARRAAEESAKVAQQLGQEVQRLEAELRHAHLSPLHDSSKEMEKARKQMESIQERVNQLGRSGRAAGNFVLGRGYLALGEPENAQASLDLAWKEGYRSPDIAYALGRAYGELYQARMLEAGYARNEENRKALEELDRTYRVPALNYLKSAQNVEEESRLYLEALIAYYGKSYGDALKKAGQAADAVPWLYEAWNLIGDTYTAMGNDLRGRGDYKAAMTNYGQAEQAYSKGIRIGESDPSGYVGLCELQNEIIEIRIYQTQDDPKPLVKRADETCGLALKADPGNERSMELLAYTHWRMAEYHQRNDADPEAEVQQSLAMSNRLLKLKPDSATALYHIGTAYTIRAEYRAAEGLDPTNSLEQAIHSFQKSAEMEPDDRVFNLLGLSYFDTADYRMEHGLDPRASLALSIENFKKAVQFDSESFAVGNLGLPYELRAEYSAALGENTHHDFDAAEDAYRNALQKNPNDQLSGGNLFWMLLSWADIKIQDNASPEAELKKASEILGRLQSSSGNNLHSSLALVEMKWKIRSGTAIGDSADKAFNLIRTTLQEDPEDESSMQNMALWYSLQAEEALRQKKLATKLVDEGTKWTRRMIAADPAYADYYGILGTLQLMDARAEPSSQKRHALAGAAKENFDRMLKLNVNLKRSYERELKQLQELL